MKDVKVIFDIDITNAADLVAFLRLKSERAAKAVDAVKRVGFGMDVVDMTTDKWKTTSTDYIMALSVLLKNDIDESEVGECVAMQEGWDG